MRNIKQNLFFALVYSASGVPYCVGRPVSILWFTPFPNNCSRCAELQLGLGAGGVVLEPGMYQVQHVVEGSDHVVTFREMQMPAGYRHGNTPVSKVVAVSLACTTEPAGKVSNTKVTLRTNKAGEKEIANVQISGETVKHIF